MTAEALIERAVERTELDRLGSRHFERFLGAWCADLSSGRLSESGQVFLANQATRNIETRLRVLEAIRRNPEIEEVRLPPIVRIMGFPRSGTTLLHNLMGLHPKARSLLRWELVRPLPPPAAATYATDPRIDEVRKAAEVLRGTELERMHWVEADEPEECTWGFIDAGGIMGRGVVGVMQEWSDVVVDPGARHRETYEEYRRLIKLLLWKNPAPAEGALILKCPADNDQISTFLEVFPEAKVVLCHRDPFRTVTSSCRIQELIHGPFLATPDAVAVGAGDGRILQIHRHHAESMVAIAGAAPERIASVRYADLMDNPSGVVVTAFEELAMPVDRAAMREGVDRFLQAQKRGRRATPPAKYGTYGYSPPEVRSDPSIAAYIEAFDVPSEEVRVSDPARG
jgi:hypothetical protein